MGRCGRPAAGWTNGSPFNVGWRADHASVGGGALNLQLDDQPCAANAAQCSGKSYASGEYRSNDFYGYGRVAGSLKAAAGSGLVTSLFTYAGPSDGNPWDEIDIEILGKDTHKLQVNYFTHGVGGHEFAVDLGFDAAAAFHAYAFWRCRSGLRQTVFAGFKDGLAKPRRTMRGRVSRDL